MNWIGLMVVVVLIEAVSDIVAKEWSLHDKLWIGAFALVGYIATNIFWLYALKNGVGLARGAVIFSVGSALLGVVSGLLLYKETITTLQFVGIIFGLVSFTLLFWE